MFSNIIKSRIVVAYTNINQAYYQEKNAEIYWICDNEF